MSSATSADHHEVLVAGGGTAGLTLAARLRRAGVTDVAVLPALYWHGMLKGRA